MNRGPKEKSVTLESREIYQDGFIVNEINAEPGNEFICFNNGRTVRLGEELGSPREDIWQSQIQKTVR